MRGKKERESVERNRRSTNERREGGRDKSSETDAARRRGKREREREGVERNRHSTNERREGGRDKSSETDAGRMRGKSERERKRRAKQTQDESGERER
jgi:hypothetical protein